MKSKTKIWLGVGAFVVAGVSGANGESPAAPQLHANDVSGIALTRALSTDLSSAKKRQGGEGGEHGAKAKKKQGGEGGEGGEEGGAKGAAKLPADLDFALRIAQMRGHLLVGDELVKQGQWAAALPHFLHPGEELYGPIRGRLKDYNTPIRDRAEAACDHGEAEEGRRGLRRGLEGGRGCARGGGCRREGETGE